jgi:hypothetical protein
MTETTVSVKWVGFTKLSTALKAAQTKRDRALIRAAKLAAFMVQSSARSAILRDPHTGRIYGRHQASAPGQSPANDTGNLARNIVVLLDENEATAYVLSRAPYSAALEYGSARKVGKENKVVITEPRPFMGPALEKNLPVIKDLFAKAMKVKE